jgi:3-deoxy-D-manno-octulosonic-acid transferase
MLLLTPLIFLISPFLLLWGFIRHDKITERLGFWGKIPAHALWIHSASMGESVAASSFLKILKEKDPSLSVVLSATTPTGYKRLHSLSCHNTFARTLPFDHPFFVFNAISSFRSIKAFVIVETELWPILLYVLRIKKIPVYIVNGRLSKRNTFFYRLLMGRELSSVKAVYAISQNDKDNYIRAGVPEENIEVSGNLKAFYSPEKLNESVIKKLKGKIIITAGCTRDKEEEL